MHELSIACSVLDAVRVELSAYPGARVTTIGLRIGSFAAVDYDSLRFGFDAIVKETEFEATRLEIVGAERDELDLAFIEIEEGTPASSPAVPGASRSQRRDAADPAAGTAAFRPEES